jgi:(1->4)-alpha-D-glucan 1-alpha-D-glucosylmutase
MNLPSPVPRATYRLQLHADFDFDRLIQIIPYLDDLGISDVYMSPIFQATLGSQHGYDVCDPNEINPELGGMDGLLKVSKLLQERGMGMVVDFVPNHMGIEGSYNWRWMDVLEFGRLSRFAAFFDIQWNPRQTSLQDRIIVPLLHDFYGRVLEDGEIKIEYKDDAFWASYRSLKFPLTPETYGAIAHQLAWFKDPGSPLAHKLEGIASQFKSLPKPETAEDVELIKQRHRGRDLLREDLAELIKSERIEPDLAEVLKILNGDPKKPESFDSLHQILEEQNYRLAFWKTGTHEINYRRFFAVDTLVGVRMGSLEVFNESHRLLKDLIDQGIVTGVRVDHIDGLWNPAEYLERLASLGGSQEKPFYSLVEKILTEREDLPPKWMTHGTTGYDFASSLINLLTASRSENEFTRIYAEFAGVTLNPHDQAYRIKLYIMDELFPNALDNFALDLEAHVKTDRRWRDWTVNELRPALSRIIACMSVYRTYRVAGEPPTPDDIAVVEKAVAEALHLNPASDPTPFRFIENLWIGRYPDEQAGPEMKAWAEDWICKLQQYTGAIMAKSVEDTFFYRYVRLFGANEVGHHPAEFGAPSAGFHADNEKRAKDWPASLLATSTHDTKMSEDVRARLLALSEIPERWDTALHRWSKLNHQAKTLVNNLLAPDSNEEYLLYQILLGAWPLEEDGINAEFCDRIKQYIRKALSEAKVHTNWSNPNEAWLKACDKFIETILDRRASASFWEDFVPFAEKLAVQGMKMSLVQIALKLTVPGVPDFYQGTEIWDFSLVDPDNRRPVDYGERQQFLEGLNQAYLDGLFSSWKDGRIKMHVIRTLLRHRREQPDLFSRGSYAPQMIKGRHAERFVAFTREYENRRLLVVALRRLDENDVSDLMELCEGGTVSVPEPVTPWRDLFTGREVGCDSLELPLSQFFSSIPVAVFVA